MTAARFIDVGKNFIIDHERAALIVTGWEKLDKLPPGILILRLKNTISAIIIINLTAFQINTSPEVELNNDII